MQSVRRLHDNYFTAAGSGCDPDDYGNGSISLVDYNTNSTDAGCTIFEMVKTAKSANVAALLMVRQEDDPFRELPPNARLYSELHTMHRPAS